MRLALIILTLLCLAGCGNAHFVGDSVTLHADGSITTQHTEVDAQHLLADPAFSKATRSAAGDWSIEGFSSKVNAEAPRAVAAGAVEGFIRSWKLKP